MSRIQKLETIYQEQLKDHQVDNVSDFIQSVVFIFKKINYFILSITMI